MLLTGIIKGEGAEQRRSVLFSSVRPELFKNEHFVIYKVMYNHRDRNIEMDTEFLELYLGRNTKIIEGSEGRIDLAQYGSSADDDRVLPYISGVLSYFRRLQGVDAPTEKEFNLTYEKYLIEYEAIEGYHALNTSLDILMEGVQQGYKTLSGFEDSMTYMKTKAAEIQGMVDRTQGSGFENMNDLILRTEDTSEIFKVSDFGDIDELNEHLGGIFSANLYTFVAPPKAGKTKFCARICHTAITKYGQNVSVWSHEGGPLAWSAQQRAIHFDYTYNRGTDIKDRKLGVSQKTILRDQFETQALKDFEYASAQDLISNQTYGNIHLIDRPFYVETFLEEIETSIQANGSTVLIIDYLQLIGSNSNNPNSRESIARAYQELLAYTKKRNIATISPAQYTQEALKGLAGSNSDGSSELRASAGGSAEVIRSSDTILALWATTEDLMNNKMTLKSIPSRFDESFPDVEIYADLGTCNFSSIRQN